MGNESSRQQQCSGLWKLARDGDALALREGIALIPHEIKASFLDWGDQTNGRTPMAMATLMGHTECVTTLLDAGADPNRAGRDGMTPLHLAAKNDNAAIATLLLANVQVDCNVVDARGYSPLLVAAEAGRAQVLAVLLQCERVHLFAFEAKSKQDALGLARKACRKAGASDYTRVKEALGLVEKRLLIRSGHLYEFINPQSATQWVWERRNYQVFRTVDPKVVEIDFYLDKSENPSGEMWYSYSPWEEGSNIEKAGPGATQSLFKERGHRFSLLTDISIKKHMYKHLLECSASSADDFAFWKDLPHALRECRLSTPDSTRKVLIETPLEADSIRESLNQVREHQQQISEQQFQRQLEQAIQISLVETRRSPGTSPASRPVTLLDEETRRSLSRPSSAAPSPTPSASHDTPAKTHSEPSDCVICFDGEQCVACLPCGHVAMCMDCAVHVENSSHKCPVCRARVSDIVRIYHV